MHALPRIALSCALAALSLACDSKPELGPADASYRVRAEVVAQDGKGDDLRVNLAHEAIPTFKDRDGVASEMPAMTMAFGVAPNVQASAFTPGSRWQLEFEVRWSRQPTLRIVRAEALPAGTELKLAPGQ